MPELFDVLSTNFEKASAVIITATSDASPQTVVTMATPNLPAGNYNIGYSFQVTHAAQNRILFFKIGGTYADAQYFASESTSNSTTILNRAYFYPKTHPGGVITISLLMYEATATAIINFADVIITRLD